MNRKVWVAFVLVQLFGDLGPWAGLRMKSALGPALWAGGPFKPAFGLSGWVAQPFAGFAKAGVVHSSQPYSDLVLILPHALGRVAHSSPILA
jgi:hypothetical protein